MSNANSNLVHRIFLTKGSITPRKFSSSSISSASCPSKLFIFIFIPGLQAGRTSASPRPWGMFLGVSFSRLVTGPRSKQRGSSSNYLPIRHPTKNRGTTTLHHRMYVCRYFGGKKRQRHRGTIRVGKRMFRVSFYHLGEFNSGRKLLGSRVWNRRLRAG